MVSETSVTEMYIEAGGGRLSEDQLASVLVKVAPAFNTLCDKDLDQVKCLSYASKQLPQSANELATLLAHIVENSADFAELKKKSQASVIRACLLAHLDVVWPVLHAAESSPANDEQKVNFSYGKKRR